MARDALQQIRLFERRAWAHERSEPAGPPALGRLLQRADGRRERVLPRRLDPFAVVLDARLEQPVVAIDAVATEAIAIGEPALVDRLVLARYDAAHPAAQHVRIQVAAGAIVRAHERFCGHLPSARAIAVRLVVQCADGAKVDDVAGELVVDALLYVRADLGPIAAKIGAELLDAGDLRAEAHAARAMDAARHVGRHERPQVLVFDDALPLGVARHTAAEAHREILQLTFAALIADRA